MYKIMKASSLHTEQITHLAHLLWPEDNLDILKKEIAHYQEDSTSELFVCEEAGQIIGFAHVQLRYDYVEGTTTAPVGYLEGIYVTQKNRNRGIGKMLVKVCEDWARFMNATEFASDVELTNQASARFHEGVGFKEAGRLICYSKRL